MWQVFCYFYSFSFILLPSKLVWFLCVFSLGFLFRCTLLYIIFFGIFFVLVCCCFCLLGLGIAVVSGIVAGLAPAMQAARMDPVEAMRAA
jgi:putative ABC transport system permease protein